MYSLKQGVINPEMLNDFDIDAGRNKGLSLCCHA